MIKKSVKKPTAKVVKKSTKKGYDLLEKGEKVPSV